MTQLLATIVCVAGILWLFVADRDASAPVSRALWIPTVWLLIIGSRGVSTWLQLNASVSLAQQYTEGSPLDAGVFGALIVAGLLVLNHRSSQVRRFLRSNVPILIFLAYCALSIVWSETPFIALKRWSKSIGDLVMVMVVLTDQHPMAATKRLFARGAFLLLPISVLFIVCYPSIGSAYSPEDMMVLYLGVTSTKNMLGMISMIFGLASLWSFMGVLENRGMPHRARHLFVHALMIGTAIWLIVKADSMTSLSCLFLAGTVLVLSSQRWVIRWPKSVHAIVSSAIALPVGALFISTMGTLVQSLGRNSTLTGRTAIWRAVLLQHTNPVIGTGFESFWMGNRLQTVWNLSVHGIQEAHNGYLELYLNLGFVGLCLLGVLIVTGYRRAITSFRRNPDEGRIRLAILTAALIFSLTEAGFRMLSPIWLAFLLAISNTHSGSQDSERAIPQEPSRANAPQPKQVRILQ
jgi:exopolysaccharide production protein ExoQ